MYYLIEYGCHIYSKTTRILWSFHRDELTLDDNGLVDFISNTTTDSFKYKERITGETVTMTQKILK